MQKFNKIQMYITALLLCLALLTCSGCDHASIYREVLSPYTSRDGVIYSYEETPEGVIAELAYGYKEMSRAKYLITDDTVIEQIPLKEKIDCRQEGVHVTVISFYWAENFDDIYLASNVSWGPGEVSEEEQGVLTPMVYSNCTKIEYRNGEITESCIIHTDAADVNRLFTHVGIQETDQEFNEDDWLYRITYHYGGEIQDEAEVVCLIGPESVLIGSKTYNVELIGGMTAFFKHWEPIYKYYYELYGDTE